MSYSWGQRKRIVYPQVVLRETVGTLSMTSATPQAVAGMDGVVLNPYSLYRIKALVLHQSGTTTNIISLGVDGTDITNVKIDTLIRRFNTTTGPLSSTLETAGGMTTTTSALYANTANTTYSAALDGTFRTGANPKFMVRWASLTDTQTTRIMAGSQLLLTEVLTG